MTLKLKIKNLLIAFFIALTFSAQGATLTSGELAKIIYSKVYADTKAKLSGISEDFKINISGIPTDNYTTIENNLPKVEITSQNSNFLPVSYKRVIIKDSKNNVIKAFPINVQTLVYKDILTANTIIPYNQEIKPEDIKIERREISKYINKTYSSFESGMIAARNFQKGSIILAGYIKSKSAISKNSIVEIIFVSDKGLKITLQGKALKDGQIGDVIPVRSEKYNKIYNARISSSNEVMVRI